MVIALTTTYRHDYVPPVTNRYRFLQEEAKSKTPVDCEKICKCVQKHSIPKSERAAYAAARSSLKSEWTGIAPMGRLIEPRIIPETKPAEEEKVSRCQRDQPNRFLKILRTCYPDLYERLKNMTQDELHRRIDIERLRTTYQVDYGHMPEYPEGLYASMEESNDGKPNHLKLTDGCENLREEVSASFKNPQIDDECLPAYSPAKSGGGDIGGIGASIGGFNNGGAQDNTSHWIAGSEFSKKPRISEYMDSISRTGCIITRNKIHDHSKCRKGRNCNHSLKETCKKF